MRRLALVGLLVLPACSSAHGEDLAWRASAAQSMSTVRAVPAQDETCRMVVRLTVGGESLRLRLSNTTSQVPLRLSAVTVGVRAAGAAVEPGTLRPVTVGRERGVSLAAGRQAATDPVALPTERGDEVVVSFAVEGSASLSSHEFGAATGWCSGPGTGDLTADPGAARFSVAERGGLVVDEVDVAAPPGTPRSVVAVGDSLTDPPLPPDGYPRWTDALAVRLPGTPVVNAAIAGNRVLLDGGYGLPLVQRFQRDVLSRSGVGTVVLLAGTNDLALALPAPRLVAELSDLVEAAKDGGLRVVLVTIPPAGGRSATEQEARRSVNRWIRSGSRADLVVDADALLRDPLDHERLAGPHDHGDGLHLSRAGHRALGEAVADALRPQRSTDS